MRKKWIIFYERKNWKKIQIEREAKKEKKRIKEQQIAAEKEAEKKKKEIIKLQRELNEKRKQEDTKRAERKKRIHEMFNIDTFDDSSSNKEAETPEAIVDNTTDLPVEIIGKHVISNNVFKVELRIIKAITKPLKIWFIDENDNAISNIKTIELGTINDQIKLGFILSSKMDFSAMKRCFLCCEIDGKVVGSIGYEVKISFSTDMF